MPCSLDSKCGVGFRTGFQTTWVCIPAVWLRSCEALGKLLTSVYLGFFVCTIEIRVVPTP